jgi:hypothetical protein
MQWSSPDTLIPDPYNPLDWNRYLYARGNPLRYNDPSGHIPVDVILDLLFLGYDVGAILIEGPTTVNMAALAADAACAVIPYGTGGGLAVRLGGEAAIQGVTHLPAAVRGLQAAEKLAQFAENADLNSSGPGLPGPSNSTSPKRATANSHGDPYPTIIDPRTGKPVQAPPNNLQIVPESQRVEWGSKQRGEFIKEWIDKGYKAPEGGWGNYDIHHIIPREYGGTNSFGNLVPVPREFHQRTINSWWSGYVPR